MFNTKEILLPNDPAPGESGTVFCFDVEAGKLMTRISGYCGSVDAGAIAGSKAMLHGCAEIIVPTPALFQLLASLGELAQQMAESHKVEGEMFCPDCDGVGKISKMEDAYCDQAQTRTCLFCQGTGRVLIAAKKED